MKQVCPLVLSLSVLGSVAQAQGLNFGIVPNNGTGATESLVTNGDLELDTSDQNVFAFANLVVSPGDTLKIRGSRPAIFKVDGTIQIGGTIDVRADALGPGPGGGFGETQGALPTGSSPGVSALGGGGGGGFTAGEDGGSTGTGGPGGTCRAGSGGGAGLSLDDDCDEDCPVGNGGHGGGVLILLCDDFIQVNGSILANGSAGDSELQFGITSAGGGGSGGRIVLAAPTVSVLSGSIQALGGVGGDGIVAEDGGNGGDGCVEIWSSNAYSVFNVIEPEPIVRGERTYVDEYCPTSAFGVGFGSVPGGNEVFLNYYSTGLLPSPASISGLTGQLELDPTKLLNANTLAPYISTNAGPLSFFSLFPIQVDVTPLLPIMTLGALADLQIHVQPLGFVNGIPTHLGNAGTILVERHD